MTEPRTPPPASGAWQPGDPPGRRRFWRVATERPLALEGGGSLPDITVAYETWGELAADASNAVLVCHAWTGDSHVHGRAGPGHPTPGWWEGIVGPGLAIDTNRCFVVCANVLGGCQGSTGPASLEPATGRPYGSRFPVVTIRDMVRVQASLSDHLGIGRWLAVVGGSMGGMQVLEWGVMYPERARGLIPVATCAQATAQQIAWGSIGRRAVRLDPRWCGGDYYGEPAGEGPHEGLSVARMVAQVTFRSDDVFTDRFGRQLAPGPSGSGDWRGDGFELWQRFEVERYLDHHGDKLARRFDANSYLVIGKAMDLHDVARGRGGLDAALGRITADVLVVGIDSDVLYPTYQSRQIVAGIVGSGGRCEYAEITSPHGHDAFLIDTDQVGHHLRTFLDRLEKP